MTFKDITYDIFMKAIDIYLGIAYPNGIDKNCFCYKNIKALQEAKNIDDIFSIFEEKKLQSGEDVERKKYLVRLGAEKYPFMKLVLQETVIPDDFGFLVDRHTEYLALSSESRSFGDEKKVKEYTREFKHKIEEEYEKNGVPSYRGIVREITRRLNKMTSDININKNGVSVLIVEDDRDILELNRINLEILGYKVDIALNGEEAINKVAHEYYDVMLLDLMMPTISGFEVINRVADEIPIIVTTALSDKMSEEKCIKSGAKSVLVKPVEIKHLDTFIKKILDL